MLFWNREARFSKRFTDEPVCVEIDLPIVVVVAVWTNCQHRTSKIELKDLNIREGLREHIRNLGEPFFQKLDRRVMVRPVTQLSHQVDPPEWIDSEVLDVVRKNLVVANVGPYVVQRVKGGNKENLQPNTYSLIDQILRSQIMSGLLSCKGLLFIPTGQNQCSKLINVGFRLKVKLYIPFKVTLPGDFSIASEISLKYLEMLSASSD
jgi:hypothetical protein